MRGWQRLLIIAPAGLLLGMAGGRMARPVLAERTAEDATQSMFHTRAERLGVDPNDIAPAEGAIAYDGGYSYPPDWAGETSADWSQPAQSAWTYADNTPLPTVAELDARQAALLADPDKQFATAAPEADQQVAEADDSVGPASPPGASRVDNGPEPRTADGAPAIW